MHPIRLCGPGIQTTTTALKIASMPISKNYETFSKQIDFNFIDVRYLIVIKIEKDNFISAETWLTRINYIGTILGRPCGLLLRVSNIPL